MANEHLILKAVRKLLLDATNDSLNPEAEALLADVDAAIRVMIERIDDPNA